MLVSSIKVYTPPLTATCFYSHKNSSPITVKIRVLNNSIPKTKSFYSCVYYSRKKVYITNGIQRLRNQ